MSDGLITIIAGSRSLGLNEVLLAMDLVPWAVGEVVCGCAPGVDRAGWEWERMVFPRRFRVCYFPAWDFQLDWAEKHKNSVEYIEYPDGGYRRGGGNGYARNGAMGDYGQRLVAVWDEVSNGTSNMIEIARRSGMQRLIWTPRGVIDD